MYNHQIRKCSDAPIGNGVHPPAGYSSEIGVGPESTVNDAKLFGAACDRCGQLYLQRLFPDGCLCPRCLLGSCTPAQRARLLGCIPLQRFGGVS